MDSKKTLRTVLLTGRLARLFASPLLWLGVAGVVACGAILHSGGNLGPIPFALHFGEGFKYWFPRLFAFFFWGSVLLTVAGLIRGITCSCRPTFRDRAVAAEAEVARLEEQLARLKGGNPDHETTGSRQ